MYIYALDSFLAWNMNDFDTTRGYVHLCARWFSCMQCEWIWYYLYDLNLWVKEAWRTRNRWTLSERNTKNDKKQWTMDSALLYEIQYVWSKPSIMKFYRRKYMLTKKTITITTYNISMSTALASSSSTTLLTYSSNNTSLTSSTPPKTFRYTFTFL